jgi:hypothetical protein
MGIEESRLGMTTVEREAARPDFLEEPEHEVDFGRSWSTVNQIVRSRTATSSMTA